jgi:hypothetical protein
MAPDLDGGKQSRTFPVCCPPRNAVIDDPTDRPALLLRTATRLMEPLVRLLVANGVTYTLFAQSMKRVFLRAAEKELEADGKRITDSALSLLSGVHRKDVRVLTSDTPPSPRTATMASQVVTAWISQPEYCDDDGRPRALPMRSSDDTPSFERLSQAVSKDFHARSVLDELLRLGVVSLEDGVVRLVLDQGYLPARDLHEVARYLAANAADHLAASGANFAAARRGERTPYLEFALWGDELSAQSVADLQQFAQQQWMGAMKKVRNAAEKMSEADVRALPPSQLHRFRFGAYFYHQPGAEPYVAAPAAATTAAPTSAAPTSVAPAASGASPPVPPSAGSA